MKFVVARRIGRMGGLGNELFSWSKGWIASQVLKAKLVGPSWGLKKYKYHRNFGTSRFDFLVEDLLAHLPRFSFTEEDYRRIGEIDFRRSIEVYAAEHGLHERSSFILTVEGMYGGYPAISSARPFILSNLLRSKDTLQNIQDCSSTLDARKLFIAVHFRAGKDMRTLAAGESARGKFNILIPVDWYIKTCDRLRAELGDQIQFRIFTDRGGPDFDRLVERFNPGQTKQSGLTEVSDLLLLAQADLCISSVSSYSLMAIFLSGNPYIWYEPQLVHANGGYSIWGHEPAQMLPGGLTFQNHARAQRLSAEEVGETVKGFPVGVEGRIPAPLLARLRKTLLQKDSPLNLLEYGVVPEWVAQS